MRVPTRIPDARRDALVALVLFGVCLAAYATTLTPGLPHPPGDSHEFTSSAAALRLARRTGYPLYTWLGALAIRLLPFGDAAYRTNLLSAILGAAAVALAYAIGRRLGSRRVAAAAGALVFGASPTFWSQAVVTEVYAPNAFMLATWVWLLLRWGERPTAGRLAAFALAFGLSLGTHLSNLLLAPAAALFVLLADPGLVGRGRTLLPAAGAFLAGAAQFVWLPLRAGTALFPNPRPDDLAGVYRYTLGAFPTLRFAYPASALPERFGLYVTLLLAEVGPLGLVLGAAGSWALLWRRPAAWWLLIGVYAASIVPASLSAVPDLDVFFIPAHLVWAIFAGAGIHALGWGGVAGVPGASAGIVRPVAATVLGAWLVASLAAGSAVANDRRRDTAFGDFYRSVFDVLPRGATLTVQPGVFGIGAHYWQAVHGLRPDVTVTSPGASPRPGTPELTTVPVREGRLEPLVRPLGLSDATWWAPVLVGTRHDLVLWRAGARPPRLFADAADGRGIDRRLGSTTLVAADVALATDVPGRRVRLRTWWRVGGAVLPFVSSRVGDTTLETHELGHGLLARYRREVGPWPDRLVAEEFDLVLPSTLARGAHDVRVGVTRFGPADLAVEWIDVGRIRID